MIIPIIILSLLCAVLYRLGGIGKPWNTRWRDVGCSIVNMATCLFLGLHSALWATAGAYFLMFGLLWASYASYWIHKDVKFSFLAHGLGLSLAVLPVAFITGHWLGFAVRTIVLTAVIAIYSEIIGQDWLEEGGRGFFANASLLLLAIG